MASKYSSLTSYNFSFNSPVMFNDPSGADPPQTVNGSATTSPYYTMYTYDDRVDPTGLSQPICSQCWREGNAGAMAFYGAATGYGQGLSGFGGGGSGASMSIRAFLNTTLSPNNSFGGSWRNGRAEFFNDKEGAFRAGYAYNKEHSSWGNTLTRSAQGSVNLFNDLSAFQNPDYRLALADCPKCKSQNQVQQAGLVDESYDRAKFTASMVGVIQAGSETFNALWDGKVLKSSKTLVRLGGVTAFLSVADHGENLLEEFNNNGGFSNPKSYYYAGALLLDGVFIVGGVSNPVILGAGALFSLVDMGLGVYWDQQKSQNKSTRK